MKMATPAQPDPRPAAPARHHAEGLTGVTDEELAALRAAAMLPRQLLQPGELVLLILKPSPWFILLAPLKTLVMIVLLVAAGALINATFRLGIAPVDLLALGILLVGLRIFWQFLEWLSRVYVLTDQRMIRVRGVLRINVFEVRLVQIQHTQLVFSLRERFFGLGTIVFTTAGTAVDEAYWQMIAEPLEIHQKVVYAIRRYRR